MSPKMALKAATVAATISAMTSVAWAEAIKLTDAQMDQIAAGTWVNAGAEWVPYLGSYLYQYPGARWVDPSKTPPPAALPGSPAPTQGVPLPGGWTLIGAQWVSYQGSNLYLYPGAIWVNPNKTPPPAAPQGNTVSG